MQEFAHASHVSRALTGRRRPLALGRALACALVLAGAVAASPSAEAASGRLTFDSGGVSRSAFVVEHERLKRRARPTLIILHGGSGSGLRTRRNLGLEEVIRSQGVVIVYPDAVDGKWDLAPGGKRDMQALRDLIRKLVDERIADRRRIYMIGVSSGGMLAMRFACEQADLLVGAASIIAQMPAPVAAACKPSKPLAFALMVGTADPLMPLAGGQANLRDFKDQVASADATVAPFKAAAGCADGVVRTQLPDRDPKDGSVVVVQDYKDCKAPVELVRVEGGGHTIPGRWSGPDRGVPIGAHNNDVDGARVIWDFLKRAGA